MRTWTIGFLALIFSIASSAHAATICSNQISSCGCIINAAGSYSVTAPLTQSTVGATCLAIDAANVRLNLNGNSVTGASNSPPMTQVVDVGIHVTRNGANALVVGGGATISKFATAGIEVEGSAAIVTSLTANNNGNGILLEKAHSVQLTSIDANHNASVGVFLDRASSNQLSGVTADSNGAVGIYLLGVSSTNRVSDFEANSNGGEGVEVTPLSCGDTRSVRLGCNPSGGRGNTIVGGVANSNTIYGISLEARTTNTVIDNSADMNGQDDLRDGATNCGHNIWFANTFATETPSGCIQ